MANPGLQADLLSTGDEAIVHPDSDFWGAWNGVIQVRGAAEVMCFCQLYLVLGILGHGFVAGSH